MGKIKFHIDDTCVKCGACAVDCPVQCITEGTTRFVIGKGCISCGDCYSICPVGAVKMIKLGAVTMVKCEEDAKEDDSD